MTNDPPSQASKVEKLLKEGEFASIEIPDLVIAGIIYVLISFYKLNKEEVVEKMAKIVEFKS